MWLVVDDNIPYAERSRGKFKLADVIIGSRAESRPVKLRCDSIGDIINVGRVVIYLTVHEPTVSTLSVLLDALVPTVWITLIKRSVLCEGPCPSSDYCNYSLYSWILPIKVVAFFGF